MQEKTDIPLQRIKPTYPIKDGNATEKASIQSLIDKLKLQPHPEGGYFVETDRNPLRIPNPYRSHAEIQAGIDATRAASSTIFYYLTPRSSVSAFHRNQSRTIHSWHRGRACYIIIYTGEGDQNARGMPRGHVETFVVGPNAERGERLQWTVPGGNYKACFLLPDSPGEDGVDDGGKGGDKSSEGLLISEVSIKQGLWDWM